MDIKKNSNPSQPLVKKAEGIRLRDTKLSVKYIDIKLINQQTQQDINNPNKSVDGKLVFVTCAKLGVDGKVILPDVTENGDYVVMLCDDMPEILTADIAAKDTDNDENSSTEEKETSDNDTDTSDSEGEIADTTNENEPDDNPDTGIVLSFAAVGVVGAAVVSAKRKKK